MQKFIKKEQSFDWMNKIHWPLKKTVKLNQLMGIFNVHFENLARDKKEGSLTISKIEEHHCFKLDLNFNSFIKEMLVFYKGEIENEKGDYSIINLEGEDSYLNFRVLLDLDKRSGELEVLGTNWSKASNFHLT
eukprot:TRINITY_DN10813_c0_g1_i1.p1 TRINITY_DN10813_c0_g1~~TRINITY_DN10813_c0_g1_i1.p1  ORF type:complete len:133 (+),score=20.39 TRINITY_DN10813_c0_g1_i1:65-463(+)